MLVVSGREQDLLWSWHAQGAAAQLHMLAAPRFYQSASQRTLTAGQQGAYLCRKWISCCPLKSSSSLSGFPIEGHSRVTRSLCSLEAEPAVAAAAKTQPQRNNDLNLAC